MLLHSRTLVLVMLLRRKSGSRGTGLDLTSLRRTFYASVENVTARAQSTRGSRKVGQDSDDELSAGDLDQDDEE